MKAYVKPEIKYENFSLSESVAIGCSSENGYWLIRGMQSVSTCYAESEMVPVTLFSSNSKCQYQDVEEYCNTQMADGSGASFHS